MNLDFRPAVLVGHNSQASFSQTLTRVLLLNPGIARIALIAYLAGGWILPAVHDHRTTASYSTATVQPSCSACTHCKSEHESKTTVEHTAGESSELFTGVEVHQCGLCPLCVARTMTSQPISDSAKLWFAPLVDQPRLIEAIPDVEPILLNLSARGPPCSV